MNIFGLSITRTKALTLSSPLSGRGWFPIVRESYAGAWQQNVEVTLTDVLSHPIVYACVSLIASDIAKMGVRLVALDDNGIWNEVDNNPSFSPVLRKPNGWQNRIQFWEQYIISKLAHGNTYVLKARDNRSVVTAMYLLDPCRVRPLLAPDGSVFYELKLDVLNGQPQDLVYVPAREMIHDRMTPLYHGLIGISPIYASGLAATLGLKILQNSAKLFANGANPGGVLTAPGAISQQTADRLKAYWDDNYTGDNVGKVAVLGDGLKFERMTMSAADSQLKDQGDWVSRLICSTFHVPAYMVGVGPAPLNNNVEALQQQYYTQCLQIHIESAEACLDEGLGLAPDKINGVRLGTEFDLDNLLRMDSATMMATIKEAVGSGVMKPNEARLKLNLEPVSGGDTPYLQVQNFSLAALNIRDTKVDPFAPVTPPTPAAPPDTPPKLSDTTAPKGLDDVTEADIAAWMRKELAMAAA